MTWRWERIAKAEVLAASASSSASSDAAAAASQMSIFSIFHNYPLIAAVVAFAIAQFLKFFTNWLWCFFCWLLLRCSSFRGNFLGGCQLPVVLILWRILLVQISKVLSNSDLAVLKERRWDPRQLIASGGMPSSHTSTVVALTMSIGLQDGFAGSLFAVATILACVVMHDAVGVRLHAGRQAEVLNKIVYELPEEHPLADARPLRELLGHTPLQVTAGGMLGLVVAVVFYLVSKTCAQVQ